jgi:polyhydroxybutyrate depolymerase
MARLTHFDEIADREGFVVAYPDGFRRLWAARRLFAQGVDDIGFVSALINKLTNEHHIDPSKVYAAGISNGGFFLQSLAFELPGEIKALATVAATMPIAFAEAQSLTRPVSVMLIHGTQDPLVPFEGGRVRAGARGRILSAPDSAVKWAQLNGCSTNQTVSYLRNRVEDSTRIRVENWASGLENSEVLMYVVEGCGHTWPGGWQYLPERVIGKTTRNLDASEEIVAFFKRH